MTTLLLATALTLAQVPAPTTPLTPADVPTADPSPPKKLRLLRRADALGYAGATTLIVGAGFWSFMVAALVAGNARANRYNSVVAELNDDPRPPDADEQRRLGDILRSGRADNRLAIAGGVTAGVLTVIGAVLLGRASVLRRTARDVSPLVLPRGLGVGWRLDF